MDKTKRWYLWEFSDGATIVSAYKADAGQLKSCTEVRLVPVGCEEAKLLDSDHVTLRVAPDSLEAAIAGTRRGERWADSKGRILEPMVGLASLWVKDKDRLLQQANLSLPWHRVEEPLKCPACAGDDLLYLPIENDYQFMCNSCGVRGPRRANKSEAREAFRRMGR